MVDQDLLRPAMLPWDLASPRHARATLEVHTAAAEIFSRDWAGDLPRGGASQRGRGAGATDNTHPPGAPSASTALLPASASMSSRCAGVRFDGTKVEDALRDAQRRGAHAEMLELINTMVEMCEELGGYRESVSALLNKALSISLVGFGRDHPQTLNALMELVEFHLEEGVDDYDAALPFLQNIVALCRRTRGRDDTCLLNSLQALADVHIKRGRRELALPLSRELLAVCRRRYGNQDPRTLRTLVDVGCLLLSLDQVLEGGQLMLEAVMCIEKTHGKDHKDVRTLMGVLYDCVPSKEDSLIRSEDCDRHLERR